MSCDFKEGDVIEHPPVPNHTSCEGVYALAVVHENKVHLVLMAGCKPRQDTWPCPVSRLDEHWRKAGEVSRER